LGERGFGGNGTRSPGENHFRGSKRETKVRGTNERAEGKKANVVIKKPKNIV